MDIAIVVVTYNRIDSLKRLLCSLSNAVYCQSVSLIISIDKSDSSIIEEYADSFDWKYGPKIVKKHAFNLGLRKHILSIGDFTEYYDGIVVLEDDLVVSPSFFYYTLDTLSKYSGDERIAGISLYNFSTNFQNYLPFIPEKNGFDVFFFQNAQSWGQIWTKDKWNEFKKWYENNNEEFTEKPNIPLNICKWGKNSWLKYHIKYCIECNKYFVYPYISLSFNSGESGTHSKVLNNNPHCEINWGVQEHFRLPGFEDAIKYDAFYERVGLENYLSIKDVCVDIYGSKGNREGKRFWLTTNREPYKIIDEYGLMYIPVEENIIQAVKGKGIFLYDTHMRATKPYNNTLDVANYLYKTNGLFRFYYKRGLIKSSYLLLKSFLHKLH